MIYITGCNRTTTPSMRHACHVTLTIVIPNPHHSGVQGQKASTNLIVMAGAYSSTFQDGIMATRWGAAPYDGFVVRGVTAVCGGIVVDMVVVFIQMLLAAVDGRVGVAHDGVMVVSNQQSLFPPMYEGVLATN
jgi:hypothetical protein